MAIRCRHLPTRTAVSEDNPLLKDTCQYGDRPTVLNSQRAYMCSYFYHIYPITLRMKIVPNGLKESPCNTYVQESLQCCVIKLSVFSILQDIPCCLSISVQQGHNKRLNVIVFLSMRMSTIFPPTYKQHPLSQTEHPLVTRKINLLDPGDFKFRYVSLFLKHGMYKQVRRALVSTHL